jgi:hypothetical protein
LAKATENRDAFSYHHQFHLNGTHEQKFPTDGLKGASFNLQDTLARITDLGSIYHRCTGELPSALPASLSIPQFDGAFFGIDTHFGFTHEKLREAFGLNEQWTPRGRMLNSYTFSVSEGTDWKPCMPHMEELADGSSATVAPYPNDFHLSRLLRMHLLSAFLGTFARYHPEPWMTAVLGHADGDHIMPIIRTAISLVDTEYPRLIVQEIERRLHRDTAI